MYPGFGETNLQHKEELVLKLVKVISSKTKDFKIVIFSHSSKKLSINNPNIEIFYENGIIGQFLFKHITPTFLKSQQVSHIMIIMDDIEVFDNFDIHFYIQKTEECDIISPSLTNDSMYSHEYMLQKFGQDLLK